MSVVDQLSRYALTRHALLLRWYQQVLHKSQCLECFPEKRNLQLSTLHLKSELPFIRPEDRLQQQQQQHQQQQRNSSESTEETHANTYMRI
ncbi:hypothetical protein PS6_002302 [Mucor atramentarius]